jgi:hypothetical protein
VEEEGESSPHGESSTVPAPPSPGANPTQNCHHPHTLFILFYIPTFLLSLILAALVTVTRRERESSHCEATVVMAPQKSRPRRQASPAKSRTLQTGHHQQSLQMKLDTDVLPVATDAVITAKQLVEEFKLDAANTTVRLEAATTSRMLLVLVFPELISRSS